LEAMTKTMSAAGTWVTTARSKRRTNSLRLRVLRQVLAAARLICGLATRL
jgi:hypothetical protein